MPAGLERAMIAGAGTPLSVLRARAAAEPDLAAALAALVLELTAARPARAGGLRSLRRATARLVGGGLVDAAGRPVDAPDDPDVRVVHPLDLTDAERAAWASALRAQPFPQLRRPTFATPPVALPAGALPPEVFAGRLARQGWAPDEQGQGATWTVTPRGVTVRVVHDPLRAGGPVAIRAVHFLDAAGAHLPADAIPPVARSEGWRAVLSLLAG